MSDRNIRVVDLSAIERNMRMIRSSVPPHVMIMAVVKADGYGHGAVKTAEAAARGGADMLAVASVAEGIQLRENGIKMPVLVLGAVTEDDVYDGIKHDLIQTICSPSMAVLCENAANLSGKQAEVHMKVDTGMGRIGVRNEEERDRLLSAISKCRHVRLAGVFTHFSDADGKEEGVRYTKEQYQRFLRITEMLPREVIRHCSNSAAIHRFPEMSLDMVRAGISMYGYPPVKNPLCLQPCMTWSAKISYIKELPPGSYVSYGRDYCCDMPVRIATITCGYADGYHRAAGPDGYVLIRGKKAKIIGRICMDQMMADISDIEQASVGDRVILIGKDGNESITAEDIAGWAGTISYEILLSSGSRVDRVFR